MKKMFFIVLLFPCMMFAQQEPLQEGCSKETLVKTLYAYKKIKDSKRYDSDSIKRGIQVLQVGCLLVEHPIAKLIGAVLELASVGMDAYEMFGNAAIPEEVLQERRYNDIFIPERFYFEIMCKKLTDLKKEFVEIKNIVCDAYDFKQPVFGEVFDPCVITIAQELSYNHFQKEQLRYARQKKMYDLEQEVVDAQYQIAWHVSELIRARSEALQNVKKVATLVSEAKSSLESSSYVAKKDQFLDLYAKQIYLEKLMNIYINYNAKILLLIHFFKQSLHADAVKKTSNIMDVISQVESEIVACDLRGM